MHRLASFLEWLAGPEQDVFIYWDRLLIRWRCYVRIDREYRPLPLFIVQNG